MLASPGQTYVVANFRTNGMGPFDASILAHEIAEWVNEPGGFNAVPAWGNIGEVTGCKRYLEVGDPLTQTDLPPITGPNGFAYHLQELAYFSWFFRTPSIAAGAQFSDDGTLITNAGPVCPESRTASQSSGRSRISNLARLFVPVPGTHLHTAPKLIGNPLQ
ncbi:MAG TPA: hypothetical protein VMH81_24345 [Bryobacteraceae bacterium]|nr:hypothetical protein [Bryobacteraceae bacterium]